MCLLLLFLDTWEALDGHHDHTKVDEARYFINVCHDVLKQGETSGCPAGAAACLKSKDVMFLSASVFTMIGDSEKSNCLYIDLFLY